MAKEVIKLSAGVAAVQIYSSYTDCGMCEIGRVTLPHILRSETMYESDARKEAYRDMLLHLREGEFNDKDDWEEYYYKGQAVFSDAEEGEASPSPSIAEMMQVGEEMARAGELNLVWSNPVHNPNSSRRIKVWVLQLDGSYHSGAIPRAHSQYNKGE